MIILKIAVQFNKETSLKNMPSALTICHRAKALPKSECYHASRCPIKIGFKLLGKDLLQGI